MGDAHQVARGTHLLGHVRVARQDAGLAAAVALAHDGREVLLDEVEGRVVDVEVVGAHVDVVDARPFRDAAGPLDVEDGLDAAAEADGRGGPRVRHERLGDRVRGQAELRAEGVDVGLRDRRGADDADGHARPVEHLAADPGTVQARHVVRGGPVGRSHQVEPSGVLPGVPVDAWVHAARGKTRRLSDGFQRDRLGDEVVRVVQAERDVREVLGQRGRRRHGVVRLGADAVMVHLGLEGGLNLRHRPGEGDARGERRGAMHLEALRLQPRRRAREVFGPCAEARPVRVGCEPPVVQRRVLVELRGGERVAVGALRVAELEEEREVRQARVGIEASLVELGAGERMRAAREANGARACGRSRGAAGADADRRERGGRGRGLMAGGLVAPGRSQRERHRHRPRTPSQPANRDALSHEPASARAHSIGVRCERALAARASALAQPSGAESCREDVGGTTRGAVTDAPKASWSGVARYHRAMSKDVILVTGGTGNIGAAVVARLAADVTAPEVRVASRDHRSKGAAVVRSLNPETVTPVPFDVDQPDTMRTALEGVTKLVVIAPFVPDMALDENIAAAARAAGTVQLVVKSSVTGARAPTSEPPPGAVPLGHWKGEQAFRSWCPTVVIRPNIFMQHFLTTPGLYTSRADRFNLPTGQAKVSWLDRGTSARGGGAGAREPGGAGTVRRQGVRADGTHGADGGGGGAVLSLVTRRTFTRRRRRRGLRRALQGARLSDICKHFYGEAAGGWSRRSTKSFVKLLGRQTTRVHEVRHGRTPLLRPAGGD